MERKIFSLILSGIIFISAVVILVLGQGTSSAEECRMIKISGQPGGQVALRLAPDTTTINKDTCVVWINFARTDEVQVVFEEGKVCEDVTEAPVGFKLDAMNCYVTNFIPFGGTSSLLFKVPGEFKYVLKAGGKKLNGKIIVTASE